MSRTSRSRLIFLGALAALAFPAACGSSGVVGGNCKPNYLACDHVCVDGQNDASNCGACGHHCDAGVSCVNALCGGPDASAGSAGSSNSGAGSGGDSSLAGAGNEAGDSNAGSGGRNTAGSGGVSNAGTGGANDAGNGGLGDAGRGGEAGTPDCGTPPFDTPAACGDCNTQCTGDTPICSPDGVGGFHCVEKCDPPFVLCGAQCVDLNIDPNHCGNCGTVCPSGICQGGKCVGANVGHVVVACMDYQTPVAGSPQTVLMGNAVFLPIRNPVRVLAYTEFTTTAARTKVNQDISYAATARGRTFAITNSATYADVTAKLNINDYDVFVIYDQTTAPTGQLATVGAAWQTSTVLSSFSSAGGVIVALTGGNENDEMDQLFTQSSLLQVSALTSAPATTLYNRAPADALGVNVISPFLSPQSSCTLTTAVTPDDDTIFVIRDAAAPAAGSPVVVHRVIEP